MIQRLLITVLCCLPLTGIAAEIEVLNAWVREVPPVVKTQVAYMQLINHSDKIVEITDVSAEGFEMAMIHQTTFQKTAGQAQGDLVTMEHMDTLTVPAQGTVLLAPGGTHIMLMDAQTVRRAGEVVRITLHFKDGTRQTVEAVVKAVNP